jgi:hypothetical protein
MTKRQGFSSRVRSAVAALRAFLTLRCIRCLCACDSPSLRAEVISTRATGQVLQAASMSNHLSALVNDLRTAIKDAFLRSDQVVAALEQMGHSFEVALDVGASDQEHRLG